MSTHGISDKTLSNSSASVILALMATSREAVKQIGTHAAGQAIAFGALTAAQSIAYQSDDDHRNAIANYMRSRGKDVSKEVRTNAREWLEKTFEINKPAMGARSKDVFMYNNRVSRVQTAFKRAIGYAERGIRFEMDGKRVFITADSYRKIAPDYTGSHPIEVTTMKEKDAVTWSGLVPKAAPTTTTAGQPVSVSGTASNFVPVCNVLMQSAEKLDAHKLDGSQQVAALRAFFALANVLGATHDKAMVAKLDALEKEPARKAS